MTTDGLNWQGSRVVTALRAHMPLVPKHRHGVLIG